MNLRMHLKTSVTLCLILVSASALLPAQALAQAGKKSGAAAQPEDPNKLDVSDLEKKYWAAKDTDFSVVQNRLFPKANRLALTAQYGFLVNDPYSDGPTWAVTSNYYFSERYGVELTYSATEATDNKATQAYKTLPGAISPNYNTIDSFYGASFNWVPFYAKMSFLGFKILYFDMAISPGLGMTSYVQQMDTGNEKKSTVTFTLDVTQSVFLSRNFAVRVDYKNRWFQEEIREYSNGIGNTNPNAVVSDDLNHTSVLMFGFTYFF